MFIALFFASGPPLKLNPALTPMVRRWAVTASTSAGFLIAAMRASSGFSGAIPAVLIAASSMPLA
jgi:hypothetical protein